MRLRNEIFSHVLDWLHFNKNVRDQAHLAQIIGIDAASMSRIMNGKNEPVTNKTNEYVESTPEIVLEAGLMRVKVDGEWKTGKVYVKQNGRWHRAKSVDVKVKGEWIES
jgi:hypothetical protein